MEEFVIERPLHEQVPESKVINRPLPIVQTGGPITHIKWRENTIQFVDGNDHDQDDPTLTPIPEGVNLEWCRPNFETKTLESNIERAQALKWEETKVYRDNRRFGGVFTGKGRMQSDPYSRDMVDGAVGMANEIGDTFSVNWTMEDNTVMPHNRQEIVQAGLAMGYWYAICQDAGTWVRGQIYAYTEVDDILNLDVGALFEAALAAAYAPNPVP